MPFHIFGSLYRGGQSERFSYKEKHQDFYVFFCLGRYLQNQTHFCNEREGSGEPVADSGGVRGVQMHPPLAASNVFLRT